MIKKYRFLGYLSFMLGCLFIILGLFFASVYFYEVYQVLTASDKSIIFWHIPVLFLGMFIASLGIAMVLKGRN